MSNFNLYFGETSDEDWQAFAGAQGLANIFHQQAWSQLLQVCYGYRPFVISLRDADGTIYAAIPMMEVDRIFRNRRWVSLPFSDHCAPLSSDPAALICMTDLLSCFAARSTSPAIEIRWDLSGANRPPDYVLHTLTLDHDFEKVGNAIHHSHLRNVRAAQANGIKIRHGVGQEELSVFYNLHLQTRRRLGVPVQPVNYFNLLNELVLKKGFGFISLAYHGTECLAGAIFLHWKNTLTYKYGASTLSGLSLRPNHLIFWDAIQWGCENGYSRLDFGRTDCENDGLRTFKSRWGAFEVPLSYCSFPSQKRQPIRAGLLTQTIKALIRKSPTWMGRLGGEIYYRHIG